MNWIKSFLAGRTQRVIVEGVASDTAPVTSGVPQGTVLGPLLFLIYINDLPSRVNSTARLFADDCLLYRHIKTNDDTTSLQDDLNNLQYWERDWQMHFNPDECEVIRITTKRKIIPSSYFIHGEELNITSKGKYLGITISQNLSWNNHIDNVCRKANNTTAFLRRNLSSCPANIRTKCYTTFVRPQLEYASSVWVPHTQSNINKLESVQRRAARFATGNWSVSGASWVPFGTRGHPGCNDKSKNHPRAHRRLVKPPQALSFRYPWDRVSRNRKTSKLYATHQTL